MRQLLFPLVLIAGVLMIPIVPFLFFGQGLEAGIQGGLDRSMTRSAAAALVIGLLSSDIFLPIPSSAVSTFAGSALGFWPGTAASWVGMTVSALVGFGLARLMGRPLALRWARPEALSRVDVASRRFGPLVLVLARPVPVLAEASVLLMGTTDLGWGRFLVPVASSNLGIAAAYAALGHLVALPLALAASIALPLLLAAVARALWPRAAKGQS